jgi:metallo-beta-lactamase class B
MKLQLTTALLLAVTLPVLGQKGDRPFPAHRVMGNVYYVGSTEYASFLITSSAGHILINSSFESTVPWIRASIEKLGFRFQDVKILLTSHAHADHVAGNFLVQELTGAKTMVMVGDEELVRSGGRDDFHYGDKSAFKPSRVDHVLHDGEEVKLGDSVLTAHLTPGHTKGCTTWKMKATEAGKTYDVVIIGSPNVNPGYKLVDNAKYPSIATDFARTFKVLKSLHCDVFLGAHGNYYDMAEKYKLLESHPSRNPFIDPDGYRAYVESKEKAYLAELARQKK